MEKTIREIVLEDIEQSSWCAGSYPGNLWLHFIPESVGYHSMRWRRKDLAKRYPDSWGLDLSNGTVMQDDEEDDDYSFEEIGLSSFYLGQNFHEQYAVYDGAVQELGHNIMEFQQRVFDFNLKKTPDGITGKRLLLADLKDPFVNEFLEVFIKLREKGYSNYDLRR